jgi:LmbE family N-acetylglucosaminyl deacetylase
MASPDHYQAMLITEAAVFYSKLTKWDEQFDRIPPYRVPAYMHFFLDFRALSPSQPGAIVSDITDTLETKIASVACYASQFPPERLEFLDRIRIFNQQQGLAAGFEAGEVLASPTALGTRDLMGLLFGRDNSR